MFGVFRKNPNYQSTHKELMKLLSLNSSTVTGIINRLEKRGYVARLPKSGDRRVTFITLTASKIKLLEDAPNVLHDRLAQKLDALSEEEQEMIKKSLGIITSTMQVKQIDTSPLLISEELSE